MKICTITFHKVCNYGAVLQAYALMEYLKDKGNDVEIIDYQPKIVQEPYKIFFQKHTDTNNILKLLLRETISPLFRIKNRLSFYKFRKKYMIIGKVKYKSYEELKYNPPKADMYICGSDQIWSDEITGGVDKGYFLQFGGENIKRISYGASFGRKPKENNRQEMMNYLSKFDDVSIREKEGCSYIEEKVKDIAIVSDPIFLLNKRQWGNIIEKRVFTEKYILIYALCPTDELYISAKKIAIEKKLKIVEISNKIIKDKFADKYYSFIEPDKFLSLFYYAEFVVTNSFHGTAFSILFNKQFLSFPHKLIPARNERILNLLESLELDERFLDYNIEYTSNIKSINYDKVSDRLNLLIDNSKRFIEKNCQNRSKQWE